MTVSLALRRIADDLASELAQLDAGHPINPEALRTAIRRLRAQVEMVEDGLG